MTSIKKQLGKKKIVKKQPKTFPVVDYMGKKVTLQKQNVVSNGFVMMLTSMFFFPMPKIAAIEIMTGSLFARFIIMKNILDIGRIAKNVKRGSKRNCTYGMEQTSIILRNLKIL